ncbi:MAG: DUF4835 family protein, partial [Bacteroidetes bacterium]|nr:DUF4835 family protein [Bacteroidota bacterium]
MLRLTSVFLSILGLALPLTAQELNCNVIVNSDRVQTTERNVFKDMEVAFTQFLNERKWTNDIFESEERINCNMIITIESQPSIGIFNATVQIQSARPIYNTNYESILLNFADRDWQFQYVESQPLDFNENSYINNLTSMLAYYAYIIIGLDYDTFGNLGGSLFIEKAWNVVINAQSSGRVGWEPLGSNRNRYWLAENLLNPLMIPIREGFYRYHRLAMDNFQKDADGGRKIVLKALEDLQKVARVKPNSILVVAFFDAKSDELINIFNEGNITVRRQAYDVLKDLDPSKTEKYSQIIK